MKNKPLGRMAHAEGYSHVKPPALTADAVAQHCSSPTFYRITAFTCTVHILIRTPDTIVPGVHPEARTEAAGDTDHPRGSETIRAVRAGFAAAPGTG
jgi:hypothetical protein